MMQQPAATIKRLGLSVYYSGVVLHTQQLGLPSVAEPCVTKQIATRLEMSKLPAAAAVRRHRCSFPCRITVVDIISSNSSSMIIIFSAAASSWITTIIITLSPQPPETAARPLVTQSHSKGRPNLV